ncbi:HAMP domain-containing histidine kinase [Nitriliruptoraceae bacterium ZYF776]|nr:HAMP domain-containing histidine kinase [Profundirhabdus halotolerans]
MIRMPRRRQRPASLRRRVVVTGTLVAAVLVLALDVLVYTAVREQLESNLDTVLQARVQLVVALRDELPPAELSERLEAAGVRSVIRTSDGEVFRSEGIPATALLPTIIPGDDEGSLASRSVALPGGAVASVLASRAGIDATLRRLATIGGAGTLGVVVLAYLLLRAMASRVLRPMGQVASTARRIASGRLHERLVVRQEDAELRDTAEAFNAMLDELEAAVSRARDAEESSRRFLADAAHQLRTPVAGMRASVGTLLRTDDPQDRDRMLENLALESSRTSRLLAALLRIARLDRDEGPRPAPTDLGDRVADLVARTAVRAPSLTWSVHHDPDAGEVVVDGDALEEAVGNLLENAMKHAAVEVVATVDVRDDVVTVTVTDDGPGVAPEDRERVFERFVSLDDRGGSGLGLPIARAIAESHGGTLEVGPDGFVLSVPRWPKERAAGTSPTGALRVP